MTSPLIVIFKYMTSSLNVKYPMPVIPVILKKKVWFLEGTVAFI